MNSLEEVAEFLRKGKKAVICGHAMPDGDSVGSVLAMSFLFSGIGMENYVVTADPIPAIYNFLPGIENVKSIDGFPEDYDLAVILDCTDLSRLGDKLSAWIGKIPAIVNIDHHVSNQEFGSCNYVDPKAGATGEIIFELIKLMGVSLTKEMAVNLYAAIVMDTGSFRFDNTTDKTYEIAAELFRTGIKVTEINAHLFENKDLVHLKLLGYALTQLNTSADGRVAWVTIPIRVMQEFGALDEHADGIINYPRMLESAEIGLLFREINPGIVKVGFRSKKLIDVNKLAAVFGGGGHPRASGCIVEGDLGEVEGKVVNLCLKSLQTE